MAASKQDEDDVAVCRICFLDYKENPQRLIRACRCRGSLEFVHQPCINEWVETSKNRLCLCGYRMRMGPGKEKRPFFENYWLSEAEVTRDLSDDDKEKIDSLVIVISVLSVLLLVFLLFEMFVNGIKLIYWLCQSCTGRQVIADALLIYFLFCAKHMSFYLPRIMIKMRQNRYKQVVQEYNGP